jgi:hypothetical protein
MLRLSIASGNNPMRDASISVYMRDARNILQITISITTYSIDFN